MTRTSDAVRERRHRASLLREEKADREFIQALNANSCSETQNNNYQHLSKIDKPKRTRMQNAKGTSCMFIKP